MAAKKDLPHLLKAIHWWHPGAWGPPAETITFASMAVVLLALYRLFRNDVVIALFRFQFNPIVLSLIATAIAAFIVWAGSKRPGSWPPRIWALAVAAFNFGLVVWALYLRGSSKDVAGRWDSPRLHALSVVGLAAVLALAPRLFRVHPYSLWVRWAAPAALGTVAFLCWFSVQFAEGKVIRAEEVRLLNLARGVEDITRNIKNVLHPPQKSEPDWEVSQTKTMELKDLTFGPTDDRPSPLPGPDDWQSFKLLQGQPEMSTAQEEMHRALSDALKTVQEGVLNPNSKWTGPQPSQTKDDWLSVNSGQAAKYFHELGRLHRELKGAFSPEEYKSRREPLDIQFNEYSGQFSRQWIPVMFAGKEQSSPVEQLLKSHVGGLPFSLGDFNEWRGLSWSAITSMKDKDGCMLRPPSTLVPRTIIDETASTPPPPTTTTTTLGTQVASGTSERKVTIVYSWSQSVECYAYRPASNWNGVELLAELHLSAFFKDCTERYSGCKSAPRTTHLQFYLPSGVASAQYRDQVTTAISKHGRYHLRPDDIHKGTSTLVEIEIQ